jgi:hypothetical protein
VIYFFFVIHFGQNLNAQELTFSQEKFIEGLISDGFENIAISNHNNNIFISYENSRYRSEIVALAKILEEATLNFNDSTILNLILLHRQIPMVLLSVRIKDYQRIQNRNMDSLTKIKKLHVSFAIDSIKNFFSMESFRNPSLRKIDIIFKPGYKALFGNYDNPIEWRINLGTTFQTSLWKGMLFSAQILIPLYNEIPQTDENKIRAGLISVDQLFRIPGNFFLNLSAGFYPFRNHIQSDSLFQRYGFHTDLRKYFFNSQMCLGGYLGVTGQARFSKSYLDYWPLNYLTYAVYGEYRIPEYQLTTRITVGKFLYTDYGIRFDFNRQFKEINIGFFAIKSDFGYNGGFNFSIPIPPRKYFKAKLFRIRPSKYFNYEYRVRSVSPNATMYETNFDIDEIMRNMNPDFIKKQLLNYEK